MICRALLISALLQLELFGFELRPGTTLRFATVQEARARLGTSSAFSRAMTPLDRAFAMGVERQTTEAEYLSYASRQVLNWSAGETNRLNTALQRIRIRLSKFDLPLPRDIYLIKTTGNESFGGSYTGVDYIAWAPEPINPYGAPLTEWILTHELFHVLSRTAPEWRPKLYHALGFFDCGEIALHESFRQRIVTNPDALEHRYAIELRDEDRLIPAIPFIYYKATNGLTGRTIQDYASFGVFELERRNGQYVLLVDESGWPKEVSGPARLDYERKTGNNTHYIIHPEEIAAEHLALAADPDNWTVNSPRVLTLFTSALHRPGFSLPAGWFHGTFQLSGPGEYLLEISSDLVHWQARDAVMSPNFLDLEAFLGPTRFYRARELQPLNLRPGSTNQMVWIAPGSLTTSDGVTLNITNGFWMGRYEVTEREYFHVISQEANRDQPDHPVTNVTWDEARNYCAALNLSTSKPAGFEYRLPTVLAWEFACRAENRTAYPFGQSFYDLTVYQHEWFGDNSDGRAHRVGLKRPNPWGLFDMHGNVQEWCADLSQDDPATPPAALVCGGSFNDPPRSLSPIRSASVPVLQRSPLIGFRVVLAKHQ